MTVRVCLLISLFFIFLPAAAATVHVESSDQRAFLRLCKSDEATSEAIAEYLDKGVDPNALTSLGVPALTMCARRNDIESCRILIERGADINCSNAMSVGCNPLGIARVMGYGDLEAMLIEAGARPQPDNVLVEGKTMVDLMRRHAASPAEITQCMEAMKAAGGDVNTKTSLGDNLLAVFVLFGDDPEVVRILLEAEADIENRNNLGETLLHRSIFSCTTRNYAFLELFLEKGLNPNARDKKGKTPLMDLCFQNGMRRGGVSAGVRILIDAGADIHARNDEGMMPIHCAVRLSVSDNPEVTATLLKAGADANAETEKGLTPLLMACMGNFASVVDLLLQAGADVNHVQNCCQHWTALHYVTMNSKQPMEIAEILLDAGADPNVQDVDGRTALQMAKNDFNRNLRRKGARAEKAVKNMRALIELLEPVTTQNDPAENPA